MPKMSLDKNNHFSLTRLLAGSLSALLLFPSGTALNLKDLHDHGKLTVLLQNSSPEQKEAVELIHIAEMQLLTGSYTAVLKTIEQLLSLITSFYHKKFASTEQHLLLERVSVRLLERVGDYLLRRGLAENALLFYDAILAQNPLDAAILKKKGRLFYTRGASGLLEAEQAYRKAMAADPHDLDNYEDLGRVLEAWRDQQEDAAFIYREAILHCRTDLEYIRFYHRLNSLFPDHTDVVLRMGKIYRRLGMFTPARQYLEQAWEATSNTWVGLDLAWVYLLTNELSRASKLLNEIEFNIGFLQEERDGGSTAFQWKKNYLLGLLCEAEGDFAAAGDYYQLVENPSPVFWLSQAGLARLALYSGHYQDADLILRKIPAAQRAELEQDYFELCRFMEETMATGHPLHAAVWSEDAGRLDPSYQLKRDIYRRSMGPAFWRKYEFSEILDNGPASQVYLGRERSRGRNVAIKMIRGDIIRDPTVVRRLQGRLRLMQTDEQPAGLLFPGRDCYYNGDLYFAMDYMEGGNLAARLQEAPFEIECLLKLARQMLKGLDYLFRHKKALFHGAIKPENILFDSNDNLRISDFDLLEVIEGSKIFSPAVLRGKTPYIRNFFYAAPERFDWRSPLFSFLTGRQRMRVESPQMALEGVDHRADLYSVGVIIYEMATGFLPCGGKDLKSLRSYHRSSNIPTATRLNPAVPPALDEVIGGLLQKDPGRRFSSPAAVLKMLQAVS